jgi:hypothetical protein
MISVSFVQSPLIEGIPFFPFFLPLGFNRGIADPLDPLCVASSYLEPFPLTSLSLSLFLILIGSLYSQASPATLGTGDIPITKVIRAYNRGEEAVGGGGDDTLVAVSVGSVFSLLSLWERRFRASKVESALF